MVAPVPTRKPSTHSPVGTGSLRPGVLAELVERSEVDAAWWESFHLASQGRLLASTRLRDTQAQRLEAVAACGTEYMAVRCPIHDCGAELRRFPRGCGCWMLCTPCNLRRIRRIQLAYEIRRRELVREASRAELNWHGALGGRWSAKFITLTIPHSGSVSSDVRIARNAWPRFLRFLHQHLEHDLGIRREHRVRYVRALEIGPGTDGTGHVHFHILVVGPFLDLVVLHLLWGRALDPTKVGGRPVPTRGLDHVMREAERGAPAGRWGRRRALLDACLVTRRGRCGRPLTEIPWPVLDLRSADPLVIRELCKRPLPLLGEVAPDVFAEMVDALSGVRLIAATPRGSKRFRSARRWKCSECCWEGANPLVKHAA